MIWSCRALAFIVLVELMLLVVILDLGVFWSPVLVLVAPTGFFTGPTFAGNSGFRHFTGTVTGVTGGYRQFFTGHPQQV